MKMTSYQKFSVILFLIFSFPLITYAQSVSKKLTYYLPDIEYDANIPTPEEVLGFQIGDWHVSHDQILFYMRTLAEKSDRVTLTVHGKTHEDRPLIHLIISDPENLKNLDQIKAERLKLCDPSISQSVDINALPSVIYQGYSIHGNEPSGANASLLNAYYLAAGQDDVVKEKLKNLVIILDPAFNPDGIQRFSTWVNMHKNKNLTSDPGDREYREAWPRGRTNHYWFDLNRDWLLLTHPESQARIKLFHEFKPDILTDHHEMGTNSTFFFQPGVPSRTNPNTPQKNQVLTEEIGTYHAEALDAIGSLYFTKANYDDYYYGKGSTYPDINGGVGILFEQASSRGHVQESVNGLLEFPFTIRNQVATSLSTQKAAVSLKTEMLEYKRKFFKDAIVEAKNSSIKGYVFSDTDKSKLKRFVEIILAHKIQVYPLVDGYSDNNGQYNAMNGYFIPSEQPQHKLITTIFEKVTSFPDSLFYDVSAWTLPLAFNLQYDEVSKSEMSKIKKGKMIIAVTRETGSVIDNGNEYAYIFRWEDYFAPAALYAIQEKGILTKVSHKELMFNIRNNIERFSPGSIVVPIENQPMDATEIRSVLSDIANRYSISFYGTTSGYAENDMTLGHPSMSSLDLPKILLLIGDGISSSDAGEVWHLLDSRYQIPITKMDIEDFSPRVLNRYNNIIMVEGSYNELSESDIKGIEAWTNLGGNIILFKGAVNWAKSNKWISLSDVNQDNNQDILPGYANASNHFGSRVLGGAIYNTEADLTHPLLYGYNRSMIPVFRRGTRFYKPTKNKYATPLKYTTDARLSGYVPRGLESKSDGAAALTVHGKGRGRIIAFSDNVNFRGYWWGGSKLMANALFFGSSISSSTVESEED